MGKAAQDEAYFQRGSLFWFTVITLSFGYYTVKAAKETRERSTPRTIRACGRGEDRSRRRNPALVLSEPWERSLSSPEKDAGAPVCPHLPPVLQTRGNRLRALPTRGGAGRGGNSSPPEGSVYIFQNGGGEVGGRQGRLLPYCQTLALSGHSPRTGIFHGEAWTGRVCFGTARPWQARGSARLPRLLE